MGAVGVYGTAELMRGGGMAGMIGGTAEHLVLLVWPGGW